MVTPSTAGFAPPTDRRMFHADEHRFRGKSKLLKSKERLQSIIAEEYLSNRRNGQFVSIENLLQDIPSGIFTSADPQDQDEYRTQESFLAERLRRSNDDTGAVEPVGNLVAGLAEVEARACISEISAKVSHLAQAKVRQGAKRTEILQRAKILVEEAEVIAKTLPNKIVLAKCHYWRGILASLEDDVSNALLSLFLAIENNIREEPEGKYVLIWLLRHKEVVEQYLGENSTEQFWGYFEATAAFHMPLEPNFLEFIKEMATDANLEASRVEIRALEDEEEAQRAEQEEELHKNELDKDNENASNDPSDDIDRRYSLTSIEFGRTLDQDLSSDVDAQRPGSSSSSSSRSMFDSLKRQASTESSKVSRRGSMMSEKSFNAYRMSQDIMLRRSSSLCSTITAASLSVAGSSLHHASSTRSVPSHRRQVSKVVEENETEMPPPPAPEKEKRSLFGTSRRSSAERPASISSTSTKSQKTSKRAKVKDVFKGLTGRKSKDEAQSR